MTQKRSGEQTRSILDKLFHCLRSVGFQSPALQHSQNYLEKTQFYSLFQHLIFLLDGRKSFIYSVSFEKGITQNLSPAVRNS